MIQFNVEIRDHHTVGDTRFRFGAKAVSVHVNGKEKVRYDGTRHALHVAHALAFVEGVKAAYEVMAEAFVDRPNSNQRPFFRLTRTDVADYE